MDYEDTDDSWSICGSSQVGSISTDSSWQDCEIQSAVSKREAIVSNVRNHERKIEKSSELLDEEYWGMKCRNRKFLRGQERQKRAAGYDRLSPTVSPKEKRSNIWISRENKSDTTEFDEFIPSPSMTLNKKGRWNLQHVLEEEAIRSGTTPWSSRDSRKYGERTMLYEVPITGIRRYKESAADKELAQRVRADPFFAKSASRWSQVNEGSRRAKSLVDRVSFYTPSPRVSSRPILHGAFSLEIPEQLQEDPALIEFSRARYYAPRGANPECRPLRASARNYSSLHHFAPDTDKNGSFLTNQFLEVDLGTSKDVRFFTMAGRVPKSSTTFCTENDQQVTYNILDAGLARKAWYFEKYDVYYRVSGGQPWVYLGCFAGPSQNYEEKVQALDLGGQKCRFLRFVPILSPNDPFPEARGMRVSVFGYDTNSPKKHVKPMQQSGNDDDPTSATISIQTCDGPRWAKMRVYKARSRTSRTSRRRAFANDLKYLL